MADNDSRKKRSNGCGFTAMWIGSQVTVWLLGTLFGPAGVPWFIVSFALVGIVFFMIWGVIRVLRGHDL